MMSQHNAGGGTRPHPMNEHRNQGIVVTSPMVFALDLAQFSMTTCQVTFMPRAKYLFSIELFNIQ